MKEIFNLPFIATHRCFRRSPKPWIASPKVQRDHTWQLFCQARCREEVMAEFWTAFLDSVPLMAMVINRWHFPPLRSLQHKADKWHKALSVTECVSLSVSYTTCFTPTTHFLLTMHFVLTMCKNPDSAKLATRISCAKSRNRRQTDRPPHKSPTST